MRNTLLLFIIFPIFSLISCKKEIDQNELQKQKDYDKCRNLNREAIHEYETGNYTKAIQILDEAISLDTDIIASYKTRGIVKIEIKNYSGAIEDFTAGINIFNNKNIDYELGITTLYSKRGFAKESLSDFRGALEDYNTAINFRPDLSSDIYFDRGLLKYNHLNDIDGACQDWSKAGEQGEQKAYEYIQKYCD